MAPSRRTLLAAALAATAAAGVARPADSWALLESFGTAPDVPNLGAVTLNGKAQTLTATMPDWSVNELALLSGWNVTVQGDSSAGKSAVFKVYCPLASCGTDPTGYVAGGFTLPANSLTYNTTGASWSSGSASHLCNAGCALDRATAVKVATASTLLGLGTVSTSGYGASSLSLALPTTLRVPLQAGEVYRADLVWTLSTGP